MVTAIEGGLAWLARVAYSWLTVTPARLSAVQVVRWVPVILLCVAAATMAGVLGLNTSVMWAMGSFCVMFVAAAAASIAGAVR